MLGLTIALSGCSSPETQETDPPPPPPDPLVAYRAACEDVAAQRCRLLFGCHPVVANTLHHSEQTCRDEVASLCVKRASTDGNGETVETLEACAVGLGQVDCEAFDGDTFWLEIPELAPCHPRGSLEAGALCFSPTQCAGGLCINGGFGDGCGQCAAPAPLGEPCAFYFECARGQTCSLGICTGAGGLGDESWTAETLGAVEPLDPESGHVVAEAYNCLFFSGAAGVRYVAPGEATVAYLRDGLFAADVAESDGSGVGAIVNLRPGSQTIRAEVVELDRPLDERSVIVRAGAITDVMFRAVR